MVESALVADAVLLDAAEFDLVARILVLVFEATAPEDPDAVVAEARPSVSLVAVALAV